MTRHAFLLLSMFAAQGTMLSPLLAVDQVVFTNDGRQQQVDGRILVTAPSGDMLVQGTDGRVWKVPKESVVSQAKDDAPFVPLTGPELGKQLLAELPAGFETHTTQNYVICHNTSKAYAQWCGALFEQLFRGFNNYWSKRGFDLAKPEFPLVAVVFSEKTAFTKFSQPEIGDLGDGVIGYYSLLTNRMTMYDLTGIETLRRPGQRRSTSAQINEMLSLPEAERTVATIIHEATHQIAFNLGLQVRFSSVPLWVSEGLAVYFETPDLRSSKGWSTIGAVNSFRLAVFRQSLRGRDPNSLTTLLAEDDRFRNARDAQPAYAEAWALHYFLSRQKPKQYIEYLKMISEKPIAVQDDGETRLREFRQFFGEDLNQLDTEFLRYMSRVH